MISVVIPHVNEAENLYFTIERTVYELENSGLDYEILIVDNGSDSIRTIDCIMLEHMKKRYRIRLIEYDNTKSPATARLIGLQEAKGDLVCFMDCHVLVQNGYFDKMISLFDDPEVYLGYSPVTLWVPAIYEHELSVLSPMHGFTNKGADKILQDTPYPVASATVACFMARKKILDFIVPEWGLTHVPYSVNEPHIAFRIWMMGKKVMFHPKAHYAHTGWRQSTGRNMNLGQMRSLAAYALGGRWLYDQIRAYWKLPEDKELPEQDREFIEKNAKVKFPELRDYLIKQGVKR